MSLLLLPVLALCFIAFFRAVQLSDDLHQLQIVAKKIIRNEQLPRGLSISSSSGRSLLNRLQALRLRVKQSKKSAPLYEQLLSLEEGPSDLSLKSIADHLLETVKQLMGDSLRAGRVFSFKNGELELLASHGKEASERLDKIIKEELDGVLSQPKATGIIFENTVDLAAFQIASVLINRTDLDNGELLVLWLGFHSESSVPRGESNRLLQLITSRAKALLSQARLIDVLKEQNKFERDHLVGISHDLRAPGTSALYVIRDLIHVSEEKEPKLREIELLLLEQQSLISDFLDLEREEKELLRAIPQEIDLGKFLAAIENSPILKYHDKPIMLQFPTDCDLKIRFDERHLKRIMLNLLTNALKFTTEGVVSLQFKVRSDNSLALSVSDTGSGISEKLRSSLFQPFRRLVENLDTVGEGIGLAASQALARANGAAISFEPNNPIGSVFSIELPPALVLGFAQRTTSVESEEEIHRHLDSVVLVLDDDEATCKMYARVLEYLGYKFVTATSVKDALAIEFPVSAIISDYKLPDGGCGLLLREYARRGTVPPTLIVSGSADWEELRSLKELYYVEFLEKPIDRGQLEERITSMLSHSASPAAVGF